MAYYLFIVSAAVAGVITKQHYGGVPKCKIAAGAGVLNTNASLVKSQN